MSYLRRRLPVKPKVDLPACCICGDGIQPKGTWTEGNNAEPVVKDGRCCDKCNAEVVIPARISASMGNTFPTDS